MININSIEKINLNKYKNYTRPLYESYCFPNIFGTIKHLFKIQYDKELPNDTLPNLKTNPNKIVFFLIDAFGWCFYKRYKDKYYFLKEIEKQGVVSKLTSQFPSTTTVHVTTAITGETVGEHGLYEWFYYEPVVDDIITAFLFKEARKDGYETLKDRNIKPESFLPKKNLFQELKNNGIKSTVYQAGYINDSTYSKTMFKDAKLKSYNEYEDLFKSLFNNLTKDNEKEYIYVYLPEVDSIAHEKGDSSKEFDYQMKKLLSKLDEFFQKGKETFENTLVLISADHGQIETDLSEKYYLNKLVPGIEKYLKTNKNNELLVPEGYCRDLFLHVKDEYLYEVKDMLEKELNEIVEVYTFDELVKLGFFGEVTKRLEERCGNLVLLPKENKHIWWYEKDRFEHIWKGLHGGAHEKEMEIPFLAYKF